MERITIEQAKEFIPLKENYGNTEIDYAEYFTLTPSDMGDGWESVTYFTAKKKEFTIRKVKVINGFMF